MRFRDDLLTVGYDMGTSGTVAWNLDYSDIVSQLILDFSAVNGATSNKDNPIERNIASIDLVDGSDVLWSLPGDVAYAMYSQLNGEHGNEYYTSTPNSTQRCNIIINFGRFLYDQVYAFNPNAHRNPQLKITFDEATVRAAGATGFVSDSFAVTIHVSLMEDVEAPRGFLMAKDVYEYTSLASGDTQIELPTDYPYRMLLTRIYESGVFYATDVSHFKMNCDGGKFTVFDMDTVYFRDRMFGLFKPVTRYAYDVTDDGEYHQSWIGFYIDDAIRGHQAGYIVTASSQSSARVQYNVRLHDGTAANAFPVHYVSRGWMPHNTLMYPFGRLNEAGEWFDPRQFSSVKLYLTNGGAGAEVNVCLQQLRAY
jgi:hypothetical protein